MASLPDLGLRHAAALQPSALQCVARLRLVVSRQSCKGEAWMAPNAGPAASQRLRQPQTYLARL